jgi:hypothetical protein
MAESSRGERRGDIGAAAGVEWRAGGEIASATRPVALPMFNQGSYLRSDSCSRLTATKIHDGTYCQHGLLSPRPFARERLNERPEDDDALRAQSHRCRTEDYICMPAICRHDSAQRRQISAQAFISASSPNCAQLSAQRSQASAHTPHTFACSSEPRSMKSALMRQVSAQSMSSLSSPNAHH